MLVKLIELGNYSDIMTLHLNMCENREVVTIPLMHKILLSLFQEIEKKYNIDKSLVSGEYPDLLPDLETHFNAIQGCTPFNLSENISEISRKLVEMSIVANSINHGNGYALTEEKELSMYSPYGTVIRAMASCIPELTDLDNEDEAMLAMDFHKMYKMYDEASSKEDDFERLASLHKMLEGFDEAIIEHKYNLLPIGLFRLKFNAKTDCSKLLLKYKVSRDTANRFSAFDWK